MGENAVIVFDIETGPIEDHELILGLSKPAAIPEKPADFDASEVRIGNMKDPEKIQAKIDEARSKREKEIADHEANCKAIADQWKSDCIGSAALSAVTGRVLAIGYKSPNVTILSHLKNGTSEAQLLVEFWMQYEKARKSRRKMVGHNIFNFDLPFIAQRSWVNGVDVPDAAIQQDKFWDNRVFVDTMKRWAAGKYGSDGSIKLDTLGRLFGLGGKTEGITGADFSRLFFGSKEERKQALDYLEQDVQVTYDVAMTLGIS